MFYVAGENLVPILVALLIGFITGLWIWKFARRPADKGERVLTEDASMRRPYMDRAPPAPAETLTQTLTPSLTQALDGAPARPRPEPEVLARRAIGSPARDDIEDNGVASSAAAAVEDVAGQFMDIDAHPGAPSLNKTSGGAAAADDLQIMKGVGPKLASLLRAEGITRFDQIAALTPGDLSRLDAHLGAFKGRLVRDRIVEQAAFLARGDREGYERAFGRL